MQNFSKSLLDVADNLTRASSAVKESFSKIDTSKDSTGAVPLLKTLLEGVDMTDKQLGEVICCGYYNLCFDFETCVQCLLVAFLSTNIPTNVWWNWQCTLYSIYAFKIEQVFKKFGVEKFDPLNEKFDPSRHCAIFQIPDPSKPSGTVASVVKVWNRAFSDIHVSAYCGEPKHLVVKR